jgi:uncharacterized protein YndB with AHSA1/START domain
MEIERRVTLPAPRERIFGLVDDLARYPQWMELVHDVDEVDPTEEGHRAWEVELRAQVGPLARSKRLRMVRTVHDPARVVAFERAETDGRRHSPWILRSRLDSVAEGTDLLMTLTYGGSLWTGAVLQRVLDDHVERGAAALSALVSAAD